MSDLERRRERVMRIEAKRPADVAVRIGVSDPAAIVRLAEAFGEAAADLWLDGADLDETSEA